MSVPRFAVVVACLALVACTSPSSAPPAPPPVASPSVSPSPVEAEPVITLVFGGDVHFTGRTLRLLDTPQTAFGEFTAALRAADFAMINLESAVTDRGTPQPKRFHFRAPVSVYEAVQSAGIDLVSIANNHTLDYGQVGLLDTLASAQAAGMGVVGAGRNTAEAYEPYVTTVQGVKLGVVGLSQVWELAEQWKPTDTRPGIAMAFDRRLSVAAVKKARELADIVIVYMHWGTEGAQCPNGEQKATAKLLAEVGADVIVGTHAHVPQGDGYVGDTYVHYGLGNFVWYGPSKSTDSGLLTVTIEGGKVTGRTFAPAVISATGQARPVSGAELAQLRARLDRAQACSGLARDPA